MLPLFYTGYHVLFSFQLHMIFSQILKHLGGIISTRVSCRSLDMCAELTSVSIKNCGVRVGSVCADVNTCTEGQGREDLSEVADTLFGASKDTQ